MTEKLKNDLLLKACRRESTPRTPVWIMRQAGRYLPEYQKVRAQTDFMTMCHTPELAAEVTLQPVDIIGVDAAIIFSDILVLPEAMGMTLNFHEGRGPVFEKSLREPRDFEKLRPVVPEESLDFVLQALKLVRKELNGRVPLIGFAGAPWTLAAYMVEGQGSKDFTKIKSLMYSSPALLKNLLEKLAVAVADFLSAQIRAGAQVVQIFDSWAGQLSPDDFREFSLPYLKQVVQSIKRRGEPIIVFARDARYSLEALSKIGADVLGLSWTADLALARKQVGERVAVQGNLDPCALFAPKDRLRAEVIKVLQKASDGTGHIFNLGHGILPETPVENARALVQFVKEESARLRNY
jgi:uroporphyrinogen decarboxylase